MLNMNYFHFNPFYLEHYSKKLLEKLAYEISTSKLDHLYMNNLCVL